MKINSENFHSTDENGYLFRQKSDNGREVGIMPFIWTWAIIADIHETGYEERWCYHTLEATIAAFEAWDGVGEPEGWHRHPNTGRRRNEEGEIYISP